MRRLAGITTALLLTGCPSPPDRPDGLSYDVQPADARTDVSGDVTYGASYCSLGDPVPGGVVPQGFCIRRFAGVPAPRVMAVAPNGDVFVASPSNPTPGGAPAGRGAIIVLADDNRDGRAESHTFMDALPDVHGLAFGDGFLYFTTGEGVWRVAYRTGDRTAPNEGEMVTRFEPGTAARWTHGLARSVGGTVYATQGTYSTSMCPDSPRTGAVSRVNMGAPAPELISTGYRNPMYMRCHPWDEVCAVAELGDDGGRTFGAREKIIMLRPSTDYGYPCCSSTNESTPFNRTGVSCAGTTREDATFPLNDTPFGVDWERAQWPHPFHQGMFVALHGSFYSNPRWEGARVVFAATDPVTHAPVGPWQDFVIGFGPGGSELERATDVVFDDVGRMFLSDDQAGAVFFVAPEALRVVER